MGRGNNVGSDSKFRVDPGWFEYDGMIMTSHTPPEALDKAKQFEFHDDDVLCACYPKSGKSRTNSDFELKHIKTFYPCRERGIVVDFKF